MAAALYEIEHVQHVTGRPETYLLGKIKEGTIRPGMNAKVLLDGGLFMCARIKSVERLVRDSGGRSDLALALDTPDEDVRQLWKDLCRSGDEIAIEVCDT